MRVYNVTYSTLALLISFFPPALLVLGGLPYRSNGSTDNKSVHRGLSEGENGNDSNDGDVRFGIPGVVG